MTNEDLNKRIHEIVGKCHHVIDFHVLDRYFYCIHCIEKHSETEGMNNIDFVNTWKGFGILWEFTQQHERWEEFIQNQLWGVMPIQTVLKNLVSPPALAKAVMEFFEKK